MSQSAGEAVVVRAKADFLIHASQQNYEFFAGIAKPVRKYGFVSGS